MCIHKLDSENNIPGSLFLLIHKRNILNISCISFVNSHKLTKQKKYYVTVWMRQCNGFESDSDVTDTVYLRHF